VLNTVVVPKLVKLCDVSRFTLPAMNCTQPPNRAVAGEAGGRTRRGIAVARRLQLGGHRVGAVVTTGFRKASPARIDSNTFWLGEPRSRKLLFGASNHQIEMDERGVGPCRRRA